MASTLNAGCQCLAKSSLRAARVTLRRPTRTYATTHDPNVPRSKEVEEVSSSFNIDNISSMAHVELETHRELRDLARRAAWEMPLLSRLARQFVPPTLEEPLRWRYTTYLGELHPAAHKVVVEFCLRDFSWLSEEQRQMMRKLAGPRWNPDTDIIKMSCESFDTQAQNKRYLADTIKALLEEAQNGGDKFADVPLDLRYSAARAKRRHRRSPGVKFPDEWRMTPERRAALDAARAARLPQPAPSPPSAPAQIEDSQGTPTQEQAFEAIKQAALAASAPLQEQAASTTPPAEKVISGVEAIANARKLASQRIEEPVMVEARRPPPKGKIGKR